MAGGVSEVDLVEGAGESEGARGPWAAGQRWALYRGDCVETMRCMAPNSVDAIVCDPPYGLEFMGKQWDRLDWQAGGGFSAPGLGERPIDWPSFSGTSQHGAANPTCGTCGGRLRGARKCACVEPAWKPIGKRRDPANEGLPGDVTGAGYKRHLSAMQAWHEAWARESLRVLKPGGYLLAFGGSRTYHRLACAVEDAGFEIRDSLAWLYSTGFPKSLDASKAIDAHLGAEREVVGARNRSTQGWDPRGPSRGAQVSTPVAGHAGFGAVGGGDGTLSPVTRPATPEGEAWAGHGTALKPAIEPIVVARKPLQGTVAQNLLRHGVGALAIDACRVAFAGAGDEAETKTKNRHGDFGSEQANVVYGDYSMVPPRNYEAAGRWPPNVLLSHAPGCERVGERAVQSNGHHPASRPASTTLAGSVSATATSITILSGDLPMPDYPHFLIQVEDEKMLVTAGQKTNVYTVTRAQGGTDAVAHGGAAKVETVSTPAEVAPPGTRPQPGWTARPAPRTPRPPMRVGQTPACAATGLALKRPLTSSVPVPGVMRTRATAVLRRPVPQMNSLAAASVMVSVPSA